MSLQRTLAGLILALPLMVSCGGEEAPRTIGGASAYLAAGEVQTWAKIDHLDNPIQIGVTLPLKAIQTVDKPTSVVLDLPQEIRERTFFQQLVLDYRPVGHEPNPHEVPHFDIHFYGLTAQVRDAIDCSAESLPAKQMVPGSFVVPATVGQRPASCVPGRGVHALDASSAELLSTTPSSTTSIMVLGYHQGDLAFVEPMVSREQFNRLESFQLDVPFIPGRDASKWPLRFKATYAAAASSYQLVLDGFQDRDVVEDGD